MSRGESGERDERMWLKQRKLRGPRVGRNRSLEILESLEQLWLRARKSSEIAKEPRPS